MEKGETVDYILSYHQTVYWMLIEKRDERREDQVKYIMKHMNKREGNYVYSICEM